MRMLNSPVYEYVEDILREEDVHDAARATQASTNHALFIVMAIILTFVHAFNLYLLLKTDVWPAIPLIIHCFFSLLTVVIAYGQYRKGFQVQHLALLALISSVAGIFGSFGALLGFLLYLVFRQKTQHFNEWYESIFPTEHVTDSQQIYDNIIEGLDENPRAYGVMPFVDVMHLGSEDQKRRAISKMTVRFHPRLAPAFKLALRDQSNAIRVQAATSVAKIEHDFMTVLERIEEARALEPRNARVLLAQAKFYDDYAFTGILDTELEKTNRERAILSYKAYLQQDPNHNDAWVSIGRLLFRNKQWEEASEWFRHAIDRGWKTHTMLLWHFECLYQIRKFKDLRRAVSEYGRDVIAQEDLPRNVRESVSIWMRA